MNARSDKPVPALAVNRKALQDYFVEDRLEAGIELKGTEVKSVRASQVSMTGAYASVTEGQVFLHGVHIAPYDHGNRFNHTPDRVRRLLLHKRETRKLQAFVEQRGYTLVPLKLYLHNGKVKVELGLCRGKQLQDKRETLKRKTADMEAARAISQA
jgi:SsrA-binding protein